MLVVFSIKKWEVIFTANNNHYSNKCDSTGSTGIIHLKMQKSIIVFQTYKLCFISLKDNIQW